MKQVFYIMTISLLLSGCSMDQAQKHLEQAYIFEDQNKYKEAIWELDKAIELDPNFEQAYLDRAIDNSALNRFKDAIKDIDKLIELNPNAIEPYVCRAEFNRKISKFEEALSDSEMALKLKNPVIKDGIVIEANDRDYFDFTIPNPNFDLELRFILFERGAANYHLNNFEAAYPDFLYCVEMHRGDPGARSYLGRIMLVLGDVEGACIQLKKAFDLGDSESWHVMKNICNTKGKNE